jgi:hypothetical protein
MTTKYWYVGIVKNTNKYTAFWSDTEPSYDYFGAVYFAVIGPFKTKRAAKWAEKYGLNNPHFQTVNDAEQISKRRI